MNFKKEYKGFTLVELIVVITILAVLGTIAFISYSGYSANARNSVRKNDTNKTIYNAIEVYKIKTGFHPKPTSGISITYSGAELWDYGVFGEDTRFLVGNLNKVPLDPLTEKSYNYSRINTKVGYEISTIYEGENPEAYIKGTYKGRILSVSTGGIDYILSIPSITISDIDSTDILEIMDQKKFVYYGYNTVPSNYKGTSIKGSGGIDFVNHKLIVYSGSLANIIRDSGERLKMLKNLQEAYSGTILEEESEIKRLLDMDIDLINPSDEAKKMAMNISNDLFLKLINFY